MGPKLAELVRTVEDRKSNERLTITENAFEHRERRTAELDRRREHQVDLHDPIPDPDDIMIDMRSGEVRTEGPLDAREKRDWDQRLARRDDAQAEVNYCAEAHRTARGSQQKVQLQLDWHFEQRIFDIINDSMPERYKAKLQNRSYAEGASREGTALLEFRRKHQRRKGKT